MGQVAFISKGPKCQIIFAAENYTRFNCVCALEVHASYVQTTLYPFMAHYPPIRI